MRSAFFVLSFIAGITLNSSSFTYGAWVEPYRLQGNKNSYSFHNYDVKEISPYQFESGDATIPVYEVFKNIYNLFGVTVDENKMSDAFSGKTPAGISSAEAASGKSGNLRISSLKGLKFPFRGGAVITSLFGWRWLSGREINFHEGVDIVGENKNIFASGRGVVEAVNKKESTGHGYGLYTAVAYSNFKPSVKSNSTDRQNLANYARSLASKVNGPLSGKEANEFRAFLKNSAIQEEIKSGQDRVSIELSEKTVNSLINAYPAMKDPRTLLLIGDMENTGSHHQSFMPSVKNSLGTSREFEDVYQAMISKSWWINPPNTTYDKFINGWKKRMQNTYQYVKNKSYSLNLQDDSLKLELSTIVTSGEGDYSAVNQNDVGMFSFGRSGFRQGNAARALNYIADAIEGKSSSSSSSPSGQKIYLFYGHMSQVNVSEGDSVNENTILGVEGSTGNVTGSHLHLSAYIDNPDSRFTISRIWQRPSTSSPSSGSGTIDVLSKIFLVNTQKEFKNTFGSLLPIKGADGSYRETLDKYGTQYYKANQELSVTPEKWED